MLDLMKELLGIDTLDTSKDIILNFYISKAENAIRNYLNEEDISQCTNQTVELAVFYYKNKDNVGRVQQSQGGRSMTLEIGIPQSIKDTLPLPKVKVL